MISSRLRSLIQKLLPPRDSWTSRLSLGLGSLMYGVVGGVDVLSWPMTIMMLDDPNWEKKNPVVIPMIWLGWIGFGPVCLFSSYQLGVAARYGYYANSFDISFPLVYATAYGCLMAASEAFDKQRRRKINEEYNDNTKRDQQRKKKED